MTDPALHVASAQEITAGRVTDVYFLRGEEVLRAENENPPVVAEVPPDLPSVLADPGQLTQALVNLVINAIQAVEKKGSVTASAGADPTNGSLSITVRDTHTSCRGVSLSPERARSRRYTSTTVVDASAFSSDELEFIEAAKIAASTSPMTPTGST